MVLYTPGQDFSIISQCLHNRKQQLDCFFPYCRFQTTQSIILRFDKVCNSQYGLFPEHRDQVWYFCLKQDGIFVETMDFEFERPLISTRDQLLACWGNWKQILSQLLAWGKFRLWWHSWFRWRRFWLFVTKRLNQNVQHEKQAAEKLLLQRGTLLFVSVIQFCLLFPCLCFF